MKILSIGRDSINEIVLNDNFISRRHAQLIILDNGQVMIKDLGSSNGTFVNETKITECFLKPGDMVKCASVFLNWQQYAMGISLKSTNPVSSSTATVANHPGLNEVRGEGYISSDKSAKTSNEYKNISPLPDPNQSFPGSHSNNQQSEKPIALQQNVIVMGKAKSVGMAFLLAFLFGPLGLLYASILGGIIMFFVSIVLFIIIPIVGYFIAWIGCIIWALVAANQANAALQNRATGLINNNFQR